MFEGLLPLLSADFIFVV